jgi:hypothetical protein
MLSAIAARDALHPNTVVTLPGSCAALTNR